MNKKLSIVTINYNNAEGLKRTVESTLQQTFTDYEYIIIDGNSSDGSKDVILNYSSHIAYWVSEEDAGVYDAMNKGIRKASGQYLLMLNSGDCLINNKILETCWKDIVKETSDIVYGDLVWHENNNYRDQTFPDRLTFEFFRRHSLGHQSAFIKKELHDLVGLYDTSLKITSDWKFFTLAICKHNVSYRHLKYPISVCGRDGISCDPKNLKRIQDEKVGWLNTFFIAFLPDYHHADILRNELFFLKSSAFYKVYKAIKNIRRK